MRFSTSSFQRFYCVRHFFSAIFGDLEKIFSTLRGEVASRMWLWPTRNPVNFDRNGLRFDAEGFAGPWSRGGEAVLRTKGVFLACRSHPPTSTTARPPELRLECCATGPWGIGIEPSGQGEALLRTKMAILGHVVLSRA